MTQANMAQAVPRAVRRARPRLTFGGALKSEWCKAWSVKSTYVLTIINTVLLPLSALIMSVGFRLVQDMTDGGVPGISASNFWYVVRSGNTNSMEVLAIFGIMIVSTEFTTSSIQASLTANPRRMMFLNAKALVTAFISFLSSLLGLLLGWVIAGCVLEWNIGPLNNAWLPWASILGGALALALTSVMALGLGALIRSTVGGVFAVIGLLEILPGVLSMAAFGGKKMAWILNINQLLPSSVMETFTGAGDAGGLNTTSVLTSLSETKLLEPNAWQSGLVFLAWVVLFYVIGLCVLDKRDIK